MSEWFCPTHPRATAEALDGRRQCLDCDWRYAGFVPAPLAGAPPPPPPEPPPLVLADLDHLVVERDSELACSCGAAACADALKKQCPEGLDVFSSRGFAGGPLTVAWSAPSDPLSWDCDKRLPTPWELVHRIYCEQFAVDDGGAILAVTRDIARGG